MKSKPRKLYLAEWMDFRNLSKSDVVKRTPVTHRTLNRILAGEGYFSSTLQRIAIALKIEYEDLWKPPYERQDKDRPPPGKEVDDCIDIETLADDPNLTDRGRPLTEEQKQALRSMVEFIRRITKK